MLSAASSALTDCIRHVVAGEPVPDLGSLDERSWRHLLAEGQSERLVGLIAGLVADADAGLGPERVAELAEREAEWTIHTLRAEQLAVDAAAALAAAGIDHRVLKGPVFAHLHWPRPELRTFVDADLLVRSSDLDRAVALVADLGCTRLWPELRPGFDRRFGKSVTMRSPVDIEIDLHRTLVAGPHAFLIPEADLWTGGGEFTVAGRVMPCLGIPEQLVHAAIHAVASRRSRVASVLDVGFVGSHADLRVAAELARRWKVRPMVAEATRRLGVVLGANNPLRAWGRGLGSSPEEDELFRLFSGEATFRRAALAAVPRIPRRSDRARYVFALAFPSRAHRRARSTGRR